MATLVAGVLLSPVSPESPCGDDVEYDPMFLELEQVVNGKPDAEYGKTVVAATPPDWQAAEKLSMGLLERSRDLRVAGHFARALLHCRGFAGLADGLALIEGLLEQHWDHVYPRLDPDDDNDPTARINALTVLIDGSGFLMDVRDAPLVASHVLGVLRLRDIEYMTGERSVPEGVEPLSTASIEAIIADARDAALATREALLAAIRSNSRIEMLLTERVGAGRAIDLSPLSRLLQQLSGFLDTHLGSVEQPEDVAPEMMPAAIAVGGAVPVAVAPSGEVLSRQDVIRMIDKICTYYEKHEPSSPVPLLLARARRLVDKSFIEILQDLAPEGLGQARQVGGIENDL
jgi:type VI secretion system protein ImpA